MDHEGLIVSEISQAEKDKYSMISLICRVKIKKERNKLIENEIKLLAPRGGEWERKN